MLSHTPRPVVRGRPFLFTESVLVRVRAEPWRAWYSTARWRNLKAEAHVRDCYTCRRCGRVCGGKHPAADSPVADHIEPHRGDEAKFYDLDNIQTLCKWPCHDRDKQAEEQGSLHMRGVWD
ncbi:MAG: HNH endonuclease [Asticcacaulis sp.]